MALPTSQRVELQRVEWLVLYFKLIAEALFRHCYKDEDPWMPHFTGWLPSAVSQIWYQSGGDLAPSVEVISMTLGCFTEVIYWCFGAIGIRQRKSSIYHVTRFFIRVDGTFCQELCASIASGKNSLCCISSATMIIQVSICVWGLSAESYAFNLWIALYIQRKPQKLAHFENLWQCAIKRVWIYI